MEQFYQAAKPQHSPLSLPPKDPTILPCTLSNFCSSFLSNIFQSHMVPFNNIVPSHIPLINASVVIADESCIIELLFELVGQAGRAPRLKVRFVCAGN
jgi:hypothetical protein